MSDGLPQYELDVSPSNCFSGGCRWGSRPAQFWTSMKRSRPTRTWRRGKARPVGYGILYATRAGVVVRGVSLSVPPPLLEQPEYNASAGNLRSRYPRGVLCASPFGSDARDDDICAMRLMHDVTQSQILRNEGGELHPEHGAPRRGSTGTK